MNSSNISEKELIIGEINNSFLPIIIYSLMFTLWLVYAYKLATKIIYFKL